MCHKSKMLRITLLYYSILPTFHFIFCLDNFVTKTNKPIVTVLKRKQIVIISKSFWGMHYKCQKIIYDLIEYKVSLSNCFIIQPTIINKTFLLSSLKFSLLMMIHILTIINLNISKTLNKLIEISEM